MENGLTEQEKIQLRYTQEVISSETACIRAIYNRLDNISACVGARIVKQSLWHCCQSLDSARLSIDDAIAHNRYMLEEEN